jgi:23S rRNA (cytidine2498-2'-O)-methyltransferase
VTPLVEAARELAAVHGIKRFQSVWVEYPDTNEGKTLSQLSRGLTPYLEKALGGLLAATDRESARLHVFLTSKSTAWVGWTMPGQGSDWLLGIPRVRMPAGAPSRSTLKLAEAFMIFLGEDEPRLLQADMRAVDLGAAPGGWTWQLIQRGIRVTAVDNGKLSSDLVDNAMVKHLQSDGFHFIPKKPVDWLVCDMVEKPSRIAALVAHWIAQGWAQRALFNLKLPMKKRLDEVRRCETLMREALDESGKHYVLRFKQLYHDREEVTGYCAIASRRR